MRVIFSAIAAAGVLSACATTQGAEGSAETTVEDEQAAVPVKEHHRQHHQGLTEFVIMALDSLGDEEEEKAQKIDALQAELLDCQKPGREANRALLGLIAQSVPAGSIDAAGLQSAVEAVGTAAGGEQGCRASILNTLHATLSPGERSVIADKVEANWAVWSEQNAANPREKGRRLQRLGERLELTAEQLEQARAALEPALEGLPRRFDPEKVGAQIEAFAVAFTADTFDSAALGEEAWPDFAELATSGATRTAKFYEVVVPLLNEAQRAKLTEELNERATEPVSPGTNKES